MVRLCQAWRLHAVLWSQSSEMSRRKCLFLVQHFSAHQHNCLCTILIKHPIARKERKQAACREIAISINRLAADCPALCSCPWLVSFAWLKWVQCVWHEANIPAVCKYSQHCLNGQVAISKWKSSASFEFFCHVSFSPSWMLIVRALSVQQMRLFLVFWTFFRHFQFIGFSAVVTLRQS